MLAIEALQSLKGLKEGNLRFLSRIQDKTSRQAPLLTDQSPTAIIVGCSDSRVPVEFIFDQAFGDLFVIRVAGNIVAPSQIGSVEFAVEHFGTPLVVVLGHSQCGAVSATLKAIKESNSPPSKNLRSITDRIRPAIEPLLTTESSNNLNTTSQNAVQANVLASVSHLHEQSTILRTLHKKNKILIMGAIYSVETGVVDFL